ncbi:MAG TPA: hypothetical protein VFO31_06150 [Vicinamibacterales bacterium]|nr:hypothetical protein [Vicinamibacterales bacterium]
MIRNLRLSGVALRAVAVAAALAVPMFTALLAEEKAVTWTGAVNVSIVNGSLQKNAGCDGCSDAGATSLEALTQGDGFVEFTVGESSTLWAAGLSHGNSDTSYADIDFAFRFNGGGWADVIENGVYRSGGDTPYAPGDVFRIAVVGGAIEYSRNGLVLRLSPAAPQYPLLLDASLLSLGATIVNARIGMSNPPPSSGGFLEKAGSPALRRRFTRAEILGFLPPAEATGAFRFPAPYGTTGVRLTNAADCGGTDCVAYVGYSYWRNSNSHIGRPEMLIVLGLDRSAGGPGPSLISYDKQTDRVRNLGPLFADSSIFSHATGEGWYFSATKPYALYAYLVGDPRLWRYDVQARRFESVPAMDLGRCPRPNVCPANGTFILQPHSSDDDTVHSATVQDASFSALGCVVYRSRFTQFQFYAPRQGFALDECHIDKSGRWLMLQEVDGVGLTQNRVVDVSRRTVVTIDDPNGSLGHLDMGFGYAVGADNFNNLPNATILLKFPVARTQRPVGPVVHYNKRWDIVAANHIAHGNAVNARPESQYACGSHASRVADMADEIVCFPLDSKRNADGSLDVLVVGPVMTDLDTPGGRDVNNDDYTQLPKGNLDVTGQYFIWTTNMGGNRLDAFLVKVPSQRLTSR